MIRLPIALAFIVLASMSVKAEAATATCRARVQGMDLHFHARGTLLRKNDGSGFVKINNRFVAEFDGDAARINYIRKTFSIRNNRGDIVQGRLNNVRTGASTLTSMVIPGEGINLANVAVRCSVN